MAAEGTKSRRPYPRTCGTLLVMAWIRPVWLCTIEIYPFGFMIEGWMGTCPGTVLDEVVYWKAENAFFGWRKGVVSMILASCDVGNKL